jgi:transposase
VVKRAVALRALESGGTITEAAVKAEVSPASLYRWVAQFFSTRDKDDCGLADKKRSLPQRKRDLAKGRLETLMKQGTQAFGYRYADWTVGLLQAHLQGEGIEVSVDTVRRALRGLGYRWKRPRFVLVRQSPTWRQEKGGSKMDLAV